MEKTTLIFLSLEKPWLRHLYPHKQLPCACLSPGPHIFCLTHIRPSSSLWGLRFTPGKPIIHGFLPKTSMTWKCTYPPFQQLFYNTKGTSELLLAYQAEFFNPRSTLNNTLEYSDYMASLVLWGVSRCVLIHQWYLMSKPLASFAITAPKQRLRPGLHYKVLQRKLLLSQHSFTWVHSQFWVLRTNPQL